VFPNRRALASTIPGPHLIEKRIYRAAVSQMLRTTDRRWVADILLIFLIHGQKDWQRSIITTGSVQGPHKIKWQISCFETPGLDVLYKITSVRDKRSGPQGKGTVGSKIRAPSSPLHFCGPRKLNVNRQNYCYAFYIITKHNLVQRLQIRGFDIL
jgi:hypothetical protein